METHIAAGIAGAVLGGFVAVLSCNIIHDRDDAQKAREIAAQAERQARADAQAVETAHALSNDIDKGLVTDARKTDTAVTGAKSRLHALKPPVVAPAPQCGPSAYVIQVEGASPDDVWRAYTTGRNSVFAEALSREASDNDPGHGAAIVPSATP